jgi:hypothetical protein
VILEWGVRKQRSVSRLYKLDVSVRESADVGNLGWLYFAIVTCFAGPPYAQFDHAITNPPIEGMPIPHSHPKKPQWLAVFSYRGNLAQSFKTEPKDQKASHALLICRHRLVSSETDKTLPQQPHGTTHRSLSPTLCKGRGYALPKAATENSCSLKHLLIAQAILP